MDEEVRQSYLTLMWPKIIFEDHDPLDEALPAVSQVYMTGTIVNSHYCPVTQKWHMLVAADDGLMYDVTHDQEGLIQAWTTAEAEQ